MECSACSSRSTPWLWALPGMSTETWLKSCQWPSQGPHRLDRL